MIASESRKLRMKHIYLAIYSKSTVTRPLQDKRCEKQFLGFRCKTGGEMVSSASIQAAAEEFPS